MPFDSSSARIALRRSDCRDFLKSIADNSIDSIVTDPPYGISFMGAEWDDDVPSVDLWTECLRVLKPGAKLLAFASTRTSHRMGSRIAEAGFDIDDTIAWIYSTGMPKGLDVAKAISAHETTGGSSPRALRQARMGADYARHTVLTPTAAKWDGWYSRLKPAMELVTVASKPRVGTIAMNVLTYGTGAFNIDACRVPCDGAGKTPFPEGQYSVSSTLGSIRPVTRTGDRHPAARYPSNVIHDGSDEVLDMFPRTKRGKMGPQHKRHTDGSPNNIYGKFNAKHPLAETYGDEGSAARFFYAAKPSQKERDQGLRGMRNTHLTVKPLKLMRYLVTLSTPPGGRVLDPYMGSGTTGVACVMEGFDFIGCEIDRTSFKIACGRIHAAKRGDHL